MVTDPAAGGVDPSALAHTERLFHTQVTDERLHPGAALAVYRRGHLVLDLTAGWADAQRGVPARPDTLFQLRSAGKPLASVALLQLIERGHLSLDTPVAAYWPAFGRYGKGAVTVRHILSHRGGFSDMPEGLHWRQWRDPDAVARAMQELPLVFEPGAGSAYHHVTQQWVCAELVRRVDGRTFPEYLRSEITGPLGMDDTRVGLPEELEPRVAMVHLTEIADAEAATQVRLLNRPEVHQAPAPVFGLAAAHDMARFYAALAAGGSLDGARILRPETVARMLAIEVDGEWDRGLGGPVRRGLGFELGGIYEPAARETGATSTARTFYHTGIGTVLCWGDADLELGVAFMTNGFRPGRFELRTDADGCTIVTVAADDTDVRRSRVISDAVRAACTGPRHPATPP
jgi:CubicO group peptidase (beta-lactamase class C family)